MRTLVIAGANGYLGRAVRHHFQAAGWHVVGLVRRDPGPHDVIWDGRTPGQWALSLEGASAVLNLAGRTVNCRYNAKNKAEIYASRLDSTRALGLAIARCQTPPAVWLNSSTATIYRHAEDRDQDEATGEIGSGFSVDVALQWERALADAHTTHTRKLALRTAMVMGPGRGGPFAAFYNVALLRAAGRLAGGRQYVSWIHLTDFCRAVEFLIDTPTLSGPVNLAAPDPRPMNDFLAALRHAMHIRLALPATRWMLEAGAFFLRTETELLLKSRRVTPTRLLDAGFTFAYPSLQTATPDLVARHRGLTPQPPQPGPASPAGPAATRHVAKPQT